jgi:hypothetical protein
MANQTWKGQANRLSRDCPVPWEIIEDVTQASLKSTHETIVMPFPSSLSFPLEEERKRVVDSSFPQKSLLHAGQIIHQRRSALAFDGKTNLPAPRFFTMLSRLMPQATLPASQRPMPWDAIPWHPTIHLALFVHRVEGISPGLYMLIRNPEPPKQEEFRKAMHHQFLWTRPEKCPKDLPLYLLEEGNAQKIAVQVSCWQEIAGESAFSLGMIAEFDAALAQHGPWFYRRLFWETGLIGQVLYLEAEASGLRATGIGCFFDDPVHHVLGFSDTRFQSLYHFTTGGPIEDPRLTTLPPYGDHVE